MKLSTIATSIVLSAGSVHANVQNIQLSANISNSNYTGLSSIHEGAGINYFQNGASSETLTFDNEASSIYVQHGELKQSLIIIAEASYQDSFFPFLQLSVVSGDKIYWGVSDGKLVGTDSSDKTVQFYAAKNVTDPYGVSEHSFLIGATTENITEYSNKLAVDLQSISIDVGYV